MLSTLCLHRSRKVNTVLIREKNLICSGPGILNEFLDNLKSEMKPKVQSFVLCEKLMLWLILDSACTFPDHM